MERLSLKIVFLTTLFVLSNSFSNYLVGQCRIYYVTTNASAGASGTMANPMKIEEAFQNSTNGSVIRLAIGQYTIATHLTLPSNNIIIEGGFNPLSNWSKTSEVGSSTIIRSTQNPQGNVNAQRIIGFYAEGKSGFTLSDVTIKTADANLPGMSTYAAYLNNCADYTFNRVQLITGNAANGQNGVAGINGQDGQVGQLGLNGTCDGGSTCGSPLSQGPIGGLGGQGGGGTAIGQIGSGINGSGGGSGGKGSDQCVQNAAAGNSGGGGTTGGIAGVQGDPGGDGESGQNGVNGNDGLDGAIGPFGSYTGGFWAPGNQGSNGTNGTGGAGGGGGGGGGRQNCVVCLRSTGNPGSGGGGGGQAGTAGSGGYGGGASFGLFLFNNGSNGKFLQSFVNAGNAGLGGLGGTGGIGGEGGLGGVKKSICASETGEGGAGGEGGDGGKGGTGGNGRDGISQDIMLYSGTALVSNEVNFNLNALVEIESDQALCNMISISLGTSNSASWLFDNSASISSFNGTEPKVKFTTSGFKMVTLNGMEYPNFVYVACQTPEKSVQITACEEYTLQSGLVLEESGVYKDTVTALGFCDSIITIDFTLVEINPLIEVLGDALVSSEENATYQWIDCANNQPVIGAIEVTFEPTENGSYSVELNKESCFFATECLEFSTLSRVNKLNSALAYVHPNPANQFVFIEEENAVITLINANGEVVLVKSQTTKEKISIAHLPNGIYTLHVQTDLSVQSTVLIKQ